VVFQVRRTRTQYSCLEHVEDGYIEVRIYPQSVQIYLQELRNNYSKHGQSKRGSQVSEKGSFEGYRRSSAKYSGELIAEQFAKKWFDMYAVPNSYELAR